ncbi:hypothetical protein LJY25_01540 [Hymenobacter sp. BT175]|uniref:ArnT family glycosyltransferase n=1 Tax=Hymenobacter translucens TaxID=2886507 RepID=UPI001D0DE1B7|nr:hypothetical protein [Hymenobacter translucens]MCC2545114.1 hypothetical protein [Hymenobacter translucens]
MNRLSVRLPDVALLVVGLVTVAYFFLTHEGLYAIDDYFYSRYAHQLATGSFHTVPDPQGLLHDPLKERWLIFGPVALLYRLFGVNIITTTLWPLLCTLGCAVLLWALYQRREPVVAAGAMVLLGLHYFTLNLSNYLYPDNILMFWCLAAAAALLTGRKRGFSGQLAWGAGFAGLNFLALLSKETIVYYLPFYLGLLALDVVRQRNGRFWLSALLSGAVLLGAYLAFYQLATDDALYRIHLIENTNEFLKEGNFLEGNRAGLLARVTWQPLSFLLGIGLGIALILALASLFRFQKEPASDAGFWVGLAFSTLAFYWFGSTSVTQYNPITLIPRMTTPLLPPLCLAAGFGLKHYVQTGRGGGWLALALLAAAGWVRSSVSVIYGLLAVLVMVQTVLAGVSTAQGRPSRNQPGTRRFAVLALLGLTLGLLIRPVYFMTKPGVSSHFDQDRLIRQHLPRTARGVVFVDDYLISNYDFYYGYHVPPGLQFRRYWARDSVQLNPGEQAWLLLNHSTLTNDELTRRLIRYSADSVLQWFPRRQVAARAGKVTLYKVRL